MPTRYLRPFAMLGSFALPLFAQEIRWSVGDAHAAFEPTARRFAVTLAGRRFEPVAGAGPLLLDGDATVLPTRQHVVLASVEQDQGWIRCSYRTGSGKPFALEITSAGTAGVAEFRFRWHSPERVWDGVTPGVAVGLGRQQPLFFNRASEAYGQAAGGCTFRCADAGLWLFADWDVPSSNLSGFRKARQMKPAEIDTNFPVDLTPEAMAAGSLPFPVVGDSLYSPDTAGVRLPLDDTLVLRIGSGLWDVVPTPEQPASPYREELGRAAFLDIWGGHRATELTHQLRLLERILRGQVPCHTILQNWQAGGFDTLQPLSLRMPDYPPNPSVGTVAELRELCEAGKRLGRFGFRTNYVYCKEHSPVVASGEARLGRNPDGSPAKFVRLPDALALAQRQEAEIAALFGPNATFSDQLCSAGDCRLYMDFDAAAGSASLRQTWARVKAVCELLRAAHDGPLSSETLNGDFLIGGWIDAGDFGMFGGHERALAPDYKMRKLQHLTMFHGMALGYRFLFAPPYSGNDRHQEGDRLYLAQGPAADDYRACEVLYGNGAYLYLLDGMSWRQILAELIVVGRLQRRYALVPVESIEYYQPEAKQWVTLEALAEGGLNVTPVRWIEQPHQPHADRPRALPQRPGGDRQPLADGHRGHLRCPGPHAAAVRLVRRHVRWFPRRLQRLLAGHRAARGLSRGPRHRLALPRSARHHRGRHRPSDAAGFGEARCRGPFRGPDPHRRRDDCRPPAQASPLRRHRLRFHRGTARLVRCARDPARPPGQERPLPPHLRARPLHRRAGTGHPAGRRQDARHPAAQPGAGHRPPSSGPAPTRPASAGTPSGPSRSRRAMTSASTVSPLVTTPSGRERPSPAFASTPLAHDGTFDVQIQSIRGE